MAAPAERTYEIHEVAELTGLAPARLRAWERRYEIVRPCRMPNRYRAYSADQVALLRAFRRLTDAGERRPLGAGQDPHRGGAPCQRGGAACVEGRLPPRTVPVIGGGGAEPHAAALRHFGFRVGPNAFGPAR
ncbi:MAG TPA: MerR family transcriptional regulator [Gemmatimonadales bacterium]|nr:MerR family transcriptional regulator [Gemmatimonadales bacterium]